MNKVKINNIIKKTFFDNNFFIITIMLVSCDIAKETPYVDNFSVIDKYRDLEQNI